MVAQNLVSLNIVQILIHLSRKYQKSYCYPSQAKILEILEERYQQKICRRSLNYHLKKLELQGFFVRKRRIIKESKDKYLFHSTLYILQKKIYKMAYKFGSYLKSVNPLAFLDRPKRSRVVDSNERIIPRDELVMLIRELRVSLA